MQTSRGAVALRFASIVSGGTDAFSSMSRKVNTFARSFIGCSAPAFLNSLMIACALLKPSRSLEVQARRGLIEAACSYRYPPGDAKGKAEIVVRLPRPRDKAWKAQLRLCRPAVTI
jgi:hypothetical protein